MHSAHIQLMCTKELNCKKCPKKTGQREPEQEILFIGKVGEDRNMFSNHFHSK